MAKLKTVNIHGKGLSESHKDSIRDGMLKHWNNKRTGTICKNGYRLLTIENRRIYEHRLVMEQYLDRELTPDEHIHHKDGNKLNNNIDNLEILSREEHCRQHAIESGFGKIKGISPPNKLNKETILYIQKDRKKGMKLKDLVSKYELAYGTIQKYAKGEV